MQFYGPWFDVFSMPYKVLIADYRLICSLLLLEHSLDELEPDGEVGGNDATTRRDLT